MALLDILRGGAKGAPVPNTSGSLFNKVIDHFKPYQSVTDEMLDVSKDKELTNSLLPNIQGGVYDSASQISNSARLAGEGELGSLHVALDNYSGTTGFGRFDSSKNAYRVQMQYQAMDYLYQAHRAELDNLPMPTPPTDPNVRKVVEVYQQSGFSANSAKRMQDSGMESAEGLVISNNWLPVMHDAHKAARLIDGDPERFKAVARGIGDQVAAQYPQMLRTLTKAGEDVSTVLERIGTQFLNNQKRRLTDTNAGILGTTKEQLRDVLGASGVDSATTESILRNLAPDMEKAGETRHLKSRIGWDMSKVYPMPDGSTFRIIDIVNTDMEQVLKTYNNNISARIGLAKKGFTNSSQLTERFNQILEQYAGDPARHAQVKEFLKNTHDTLLGRPVGEREALWVQVGSALARMLHLKNSGIFNTLDPANTIREFGLKTTMKHFKAGFKDVVQKEGMTPVQADTITDIVKGRLINEGKLRTVITHLESNHGMASGMFLRNMNTLGQSVKFLNGAEYVRRYHLGVIASIQAELLNDLPKGVQASVDYLKRIGMSDSRIDELKSAISTHGLYDSYWPVDLADELATRLTSSIDSLALQVRKGEMPSMLQYSSVGRLLFPYFSFVAASHNKILRKEYQRNGATGVAMHMLTTAPLAIMAAVAANVTSGKDPFEDLTTRAFSILPTLGYSSLPVNYALRGEFGGTPTPFAIFNAIPGFAKAAADGDVGGMVKNSPILAVTLPVRLVTDVLGSMDEDKK